MTRFATRPFSSLIWLAWAALLSGCATQPAEDEKQRLDESTGTTVTLMPRPVELIVERSKSAKNDPFAYLAPFETNRMGSHELFLWVSAPQIGAPLGTPHVFCGEQLLELDPLPPDLKAIGLSKAPYKMPAPWSMQWFFRLSGEVLDCLAAAKQLKIVTQAGTEEPDRYTAETQALSGLPDFVSRVRT